MRKPNPENSQNNPTLTKQDIVKVVFEKISRRQRSFKEITGRSETVDVLEANGSVRSVFDWAEKAKLDN